MTATVFILPGLGNSGEAHWQTRWEKQFNFIRIEQRDWETPHRTDWIDAIDKAIAQHDPANIILVGHSLACAAIAFWSDQYKRKIKGALLVAPSDTEADTYPPGTSGFTPVPLQPLSFPSIVVASANDYYVRLERAQQFAKAWGSKLVNIGDAGHINVAAGFGAWEQGLEFLKELDR
ncbi:RBBP9/YdeN family alpha/beta hydrolase [Chryseolinea soli]|uniref:Alpha/beta hydrolase n=1 Tax=Chryseolinea soli TaxID=2321403 RepID=A0A385SVJ7_9BACT|nr:alpha/beta hydrolase [Chryseolinea soli]AYB35239.1 alpha/beta hydrolase [Chryseolinea soli]